MRVVIHPSVGVFSWLDEVKLYKVSSGAPGTIMPSKKAIAMNTNSTVHELTHQRQITGDTASLSCVLVRTLQSRTLYP